LAKNKKTKVVFLYLPALDKTAMPRNFTQLAVQGGILDPRTLLQPAGLWQNVDHLNYFGAQKLSTWVAESLQ
jgi:hypothetical protein